MRILIAGILGGVAMYVWATAAHLSPLAQVGMQTIPNDGPAVAAIQAALGDKGRGLYYFPAGGMTNDPKASAAHEAKLKTTAQGLIAYRPPGTPGMTPQQLIVEAALEFGESILLAVVLG